MQKNGSIADSLLFLDSDIKIDTPNLACQLASEVNIFAQPQNPFSFHSDFNALDVSTFAQPQNADSCDFLTFEQFLKEETTITSFDQFLVTDEELACQIFKDYSQKCHVAIKNPKLFKLVLIALVFTASIFSQQFGGNRDLPVA